jgi:hypothetical protein
MDEARPKVADLLPERLTGLEERVKEQMSGDPDVGKTKLAWNLIGSEVERALRSVLDCDLIDTLAKAWAGALSVREYGDPARHEPGETAIVHLGEQEFVRELNPVIGVTIAGCDCMELRFTLSLAVQFSGLALSIRAPYITGGAVGDAYVSAQLSYGEVALHPAQESRRIELPGRFDLGSPLEIPRSDEGDSADRG